MRCMACGEVMALAVRVPHEAIAGFAHHTFHCPGCGGSERRLTFIGAEAAAALLNTEATRAVIEAPSPPPPVWVEPTVAQLAAQAPCAQPQPPTAQPAAAQPPCAQPPCADPNAIASAPAWLRAIEKVRSRQADLHARADEKKKNDWIGEFNAAWEKLAPAREQPAPPPRHANGAKIAAKPLAWNSKRVLQAQVRKLSPVGRKPTQEPAIAASPEALQKFNRLWESLIPGANITAPQPESEAPIALPSLPRSLSLVPVEATETLEGMERMGAWGRAVLLLRGFAGI